MKTTQTYLFKSMTVTHDQLLAQGYVYNQSTRSYEKQEHTSQAVAARPQAAKPKPTFFNEPLEAREVQKQSTGRANVCVYQFTRRPQDTDNVCPKYEIDWLRYKGFIADDNYDAIALSVEQIRVKTKEEEGVLIEIL